MRLQLIAVGALAMLTASALGPVLAEPGPATEWNLGEERELSPGYYAVFRGGDNGWQLWTFETVDGVSCVAVKPSREGRIIKPAGFGQHVISSGPHVSIFGNNGQLNVSIRGSESGGSVKFRRPEARFWTEAMYAPLDFEVFEGQVIEAQVVTFEYPRLLVGAHVHNGTFDLTGYLAARDWVKQCAPKKKRSSRVR